MNPPKQNGGYRWSIVALTVVVVVVFLVRTVQLIGGITPSIWLDSTSTTIVTAFVALVAYTSHWR